MDLLIFIYLRRMLSRGMGQALTYYSNKRAIYGLGQIEKVF